MWSRIHLHCWVFSLSHLGLTRFPPVSLAATSGPIQVPTAKPDLGQAMSSNPPHSQPTAPSDLELLLCFLLPFGTPQSAFCSSLHQQSFLSGLVVSGTLLCSSRSDPVFAGAYGERSLACAELAPAVLVFLSLALPQPPSEGKLSENRGLGTCAAFVAVFRASELPISPCAPPAEVFSLPSTSVPRRDLPSGSFFLPAEPLSTRAAQERLGAFHCPASHRGLGAVLMAQSWRYLVPRGSTRRRGQAPSPQAGFGGTCLKTCPALACVRRWHLGVFAQPSATHSPPVGLGSFSSSPAGQSGITCSS